MKEDSKAKRINTQPTAKKSEKNTKDRLSNNWETKPNPPHFPHLPDDMVDEMLAELREKENTAHE